MPDDEYTDLVDRLRDLPDAVPAPGAFGPLVARARVRRRRRSLGTAAGAVAAVAAVAAGGFALVHPEPPARITPLPAASPKPSVAGIDPWTDPLDEQPDLGIPRIATYKGGVRLVLVQDAKGTYAVTAGTEKGQVCTRIGEAIPAGSRPVRISAGCAPLRSERTVRIAMSESIGNEQQAVLVLTPSETTKLVWRRSGGDADVELHDLPGSTSKVAAVLAPVMSSVDVVAFAGNRTLGTAHLEAPITSPTAQQELPTPSNAAQLFRYKKERTMWAENLRDGTIGFLSTNPKTKGQWAEWAVAKAAPSDAVQQASIDRLYLDERWVCGTARDDVTGVTYRLADGRTVAASIKDVPRGGRAWCGQLPHERLGKPPAANDRIVVTLRDGTQTEVKPKY